jgi:GxxExxY protein
MELTELNVRTGQVVDAALRVHSALGPSLLESAYEACLAYELRKRGLHVRTQEPVSITYEDVRIDLAYRVDLVVDDVVLVELKAVSRLLPIHETQLLSYLRLGKFPVGLLLNFHELHMKDGIKRLIN